MVAWWCVALEQPWTWDWQAYPGVWIASILPVLVYLWAVRRHDEPTDRKKLGLFVLGMVFFWLASDWPIGALGAGYLASAHMLQFLLYTLVSAPLLMLGTPEWMAQKVSEKLRMKRALTWLGNSLVTCGVVYNVILLTTHAPATVEVFRRSQIGSFAMDIVWLAAGVILWLPIVSPLVGGKPVSIWPKMIYLFVATAAVAVVPASLLTFTTAPAYAVYELAPRVGGMTAREDQQVAGILMKLGTPPIVWSTIGVMWFRWARKEQEQERRERLAV